MSVIDVALEVIDDNPYNPRKHYPQASVTFYNLVDALVHP